MMEEMPTHRVDRSNVSHNMKEMETLIRENEAVKQNNHYLGDLLRRSEQTVSILREEVCS